MIPKLSKVSTVETGDRELEEIGDAVQSEIDSILLTLQRSGGYNVVSVTPTPVPGGVLITFIYELVDDRETK